MTPGWGCSCPPPPRDCSCAAPRAASGPPLFRALHCVGCKAKDRERTPGLKSPLWLPRRRVGCRGRWGRLHQPTRALKKMLRWYAIPASDAESPSHPHRQHLLTSDTCRRGYRRTCSKLPPNASKGSKGRSELGLTRWRQAAHQVPLAMRSGGPSCRTRLQLLPPALACSLDMTEVLSGRHPRFQQASRKSG